MTSPHVVLDVYPDVRLVRTNDEKVLRGRDARWFPMPRVIVIKASLRRLTYRCRLAHELGHVVLGHGAACGDDLYDYRLELAADEWAARLLLDDLPRLIVELATTCNHGHAAANLNVTLDVLDTRLHTMDPGESSLVDELVREIQESGGC
jgi:Zn-dependent peptidase ImmA (M78 family)